MLLLQANKKRVGILILAFMLVFTFASLAFADTLSLWYGETKKGDISSRKNSLGGTDVAIEEVISSLGLARTANLQAIVVLLDGKKMEFWNASSVVRVNGAIISLPSPISVEDEHWWADAKSLVQIIGVRQVHLWCRKQLKSNLKLNLKLNRKSNRKLKKKLQQR